MNELCEAIAIQENDVSPEDNNFMLAADIVEVSGSLLLHDLGSGVASYSHEQVQEFLKTQSASYLNPELEIAKACLQYLQFDIFKQGLCAADTLLVKGRLQSHPFSRYAAAHWGDHVKASKGETDKGIWKSIMNLSPNNINAITQMANHEGESSWHKGPWHKELKLLQALARYDLPWLTKDMLQAELALDVRQLINLIACDIKDKIVTRVTQKPDVNVKTKGGWTALHYAGAGGRKEMLEILLEANSEVNAEMIDAYNAIHLASWHGHSEIVLGLLQSNADHTLKDRMGLTALHIARRSEIN